MVAAVVGAVWYKAHSQIDMPVFIALLGGLLMLPAGLLAALVLGGSKPASAPLDEVADQLADRMRGDWNKEVQALYSARPLPVAWTAAGEDLEDLVEEWSRLREMAEEWPGGPPGDPAKWAADPTQLAGQWGDIARVFHERVPTRRLVVLGGPGAGKTVLLVHLVLALLRHRLPRDPVPVLFPLASWNPVRQNLYSWMADQLVRDHPRLGDPPPADSTRSRPKTQAAALLDRQLILPVLDGLDELPQEVRARAVRAINSFLLPGQPLVLSSRFDEYRNALTSSEGITVKLDGAAGIRLLPLGTRQAVAYLQDRPGTAAAARWNAVAARLSTNAPAAQALSTPLGLFLARAVYNPLPGESPARLAHPRELFEETRFPTRKDVEAHLLAAFIPAAYRPDPRWDPDKAQHTLEFLAHHLQYTLGGTRDLEWWKLDRALPRRWRALLIGLANGLAVGSVATLAFSPLVGPAEGLSMGLAFALLAGLFGAVLGARDKTPSVGIGWDTRWPLLVSQPVAGLGGGAVLSWVDDGIGPVAGPTYGLLFGLLGAFSFAVVPAPADLHTDVGPGSVLARDRRAAWVIPMVQALPAGLVISVLLILAGVLPPVAFAVVLAFGLPLGLHAALTDSAWGQFTMVRIGLAALGRVPCRLMSFLADAHQRGVLRQAGAVYQFRHPGLQDHLSQRQP
ncbi:NACHT domain-containing protein [Streptomyces sp. HC307]|uniref:NACHT domain-containing protein n=1 Tax=Streptomyces flavusporus TaxID=3385496 RepID=UPI0039174054